MGGRHQQQRPGTDPRPRLTWALPTRTPRVLVHHGRDPLGGKVQAQEAHGPTHGFSVLRPTPRGALGPRAAAHDRECRPCGLGVPQQEWQLAPTTPAGSAWVPGHFGGRQPGVQGRARPGRDDRNLGRRRTGGPGRQGAREASACGNRVAVHSAALRLRSWARQPRTEPGLEKRDYQPAAERAGRLDQRLLPRTQPRSQHRAGSAGPWPGSSPGSPAAPSPTPSSTGTRASRCSKATPRLGNCIRRARNRRSPGRRGVSRGFGGFT
jgi:hypothetical protein